MSETPVSPAPAPYDPPRWDGINHGAEPQVWENPMWTPGRMGVNPLKALDRLEPEEAALRVNLLPRRDGTLTIRPGQTSIAAGGGAAIQNIEELNNPQAGTYERYATAGTTLVRGTGGLTVIDSGYSGNPIALVPFRPRLSGQPWMIAADINKVRQIPFGGSPLELGLPAPATAAAPEVADILTTSIAAFDSSDSTAAANWTASPGFTNPDEDGDSTESDPPTLADVTGLSGSCVEMTLVPGAVGSGFYSFMGIAKAINLTELQGGLGPVPSADDIMHIWLRCNKPNLLQEIRLYLVCSDAFVATRVPGTDEEGLENPDAFVKAYRPHDFTNFVDLLQSGLAAGAGSRDNAVVEDFLGNAPTDPGGIVAESSDPYDPAGSDNLPTQTVPQLVPGAVAWSEFGSIGRPVRRGEFLRIGSTPERGWNTITGIIIVVQTLTNDTDIKVAFDDAFLTGGYALDSSPATATAYDYRYTNYHTVTGDEGNPSPEQAANTFVEALRQRLKQTPPPYGDAAVRQRFYRRGGSLPDNWYFVGENSGDGLEFVDEVSDEEASAADTLETDNYQPVPTFNSSGTTVLAQPVPCMFGPIDGVIYALGDPYRPGVLYWSKPGKPGSWPTTNTYEVCSPSEQLLWGFALDAGGIVLTTKRAFKLLSNITQAGVPSVVEIAGAPGLAQRYAYCVADGVLYYAGRDGIMKTAGGTPQLVTDKLQPIFQSDSPESNPLYPPINWSSPVRLGVYQHWVFLTYTDTAAKVWTLTINQLTGDIGELQWGQAIGSYHTDEGNNARESSLLLGGTGGTIWEWTGDTDGGTAISWSVSSGYLDAGRPREDKLLGDIVVKASILGTLTLGVKLNDGQVTNTPMTVDGDGTVQLFTFDAFGIVPQFARTIQFSLSGTVAPVLYKLGLSWASLPDQTMKRATQWQPLGVSEQYVKGCTIVCETGDQTIEVYAEATRTGLGDPILMDTLQVRANGKRMVQFSWPTVRAEQVRLRPITDCGPWRLFRVDWDHTAEPPRVGFWDSHPEQLGDQYFTGVDVDCNTLGAAKVVQVSIDGNLVTDQVSGTTNFTVNADGRRWIHLTFNAETPIRGHVARLFSEDGVLGLLHGWKWHSQAEPPEQANWDQNYTTAVALNDKAVKGVILECDTFGLDKTVRVEIDQVLHATKTVNADGRSVVNLTWPSEVGRVLRFYPTDGNPGRLYSHQWIYDEEPFSLDRWETQRIDFGSAQRKSLLRMMVAYKSEFPVTLVVESYNFAGVLVATQNYPFVETNGQKVVTPLDFGSNAGWLYKFVWTVSDPAGFWLYREETFVTVLFWNGEMKDLNPFGDDDLDKVRSLSRATDISTASGGVRG